MLFMLNLTNFTQFVGSFFLRRKDLLRIKKKMIPLSVISIQCLFYRITRRNSWTKYTTL